MKRVVAAVMLLVAVTGCQAVTPVEVSFSASPFLADGTPSPAPASPAPASPAPPSPGPLDSDMLPSDSPTLAAATAGPVSGTATTRPAATPSSTAIPAPKVTATGVKTCGQDVSKTVSSGTVITFYLDSTQSLSSPIESCATFAVAAGRHYVYAQPSSANVTLKSTNCLPQAACSTTAVLPGVVQVTVTSGTVVEVDFNF
jgi:hypothetical protein